jgi:hypothetical protein
MPEAMIDLLLILALAGLGAISWAYTRACDRL